MRKRTVSLITRDFVIPPGSPGEDGNKASAIVLAISMPPELVGQRFVATMKLTLNNNQKGWFAHDQLMGAGLAMSPGSWKEGKVMSDAEYNALRFIHSIDGMNVSGKMHHYPISITAVNTVAANDRWLVAVARGNDRGGLFGSKSKGKIEIGGGAFLQLDTF